MISTSKQVRGGGPLALMLIGSCTITPASLSETTASLSETTASADAGETGSEEATRGLPEGVSVWSGQLEVSGLLFAAEAGITNTGGDLVATLTVMDHPDQPVGFGQAEYSLTGTHEPVSGLVALAPDDWIVAPVLDIELVGFMGFYDPEAQTLSGTVADYASGSDNSFAGGPATLTFVDGPGAPTTVGDEAASLALGNQSFTGEFQCTSAVREVTGELVYDGEGGLTGSMTIGDPELATPLGSFIFTGVHNPSTGGITLVPGLWDNPNHNTATFFIDGTFDPDTGEFDGDQRTNTAVCPPGLWQTTIE